MVSASMPPSSARRTAAVSTRSRLSGILGSAAGVVWIAMCIDLSAELYRTG